MITFETEEDFEDAVMEVLHQNLTVSIRAGYGIIEVTLYDHSNFNRQAISSDSDSFSAPN